MKGRKARHIHFETHAIKRLRKRGISEAQVEGVVKKPDVRRDAKRKGAVRLEKRISARKRLVVIVEEAKDYV